MRTGYDTKTAILPALLDRYRVVSLIQFLMVIRGTFVLFKLIWLSVCEDLCLLMCQLLERTLLHYCVDLLIIKAA